MILKNRTVPIFLLCLLAMTSWQTPYIFASEVIEETGTRIIVREHPKTGRPYVSVVSSQGEIPPGPFTGQRKYSRPDYRMLDSKIKSGQIPYGGPYSDRTKVYVFAASLATLGTASGAMVIAAAPAATGAAASGGAGAYLAGGSAVAAGSSATVAIAAKPDPRKENYTHRSESQLVQKKEDRPSSSQEGFDTGGIDRADFE